MTSFFTYFLMFLSTSYLNINRENTNLQNLKQSNPFPIRNLKKIQHIFNLQSSSASGIFTYKSFNFSNSPFEKNGRQSLDWREIQESYKTKLSWVHFYALKNLSNQEMRLDFQNSYDSLFLSRAWLFDLLLNSTSQTFNQTLLFKKFLNTLTLHDAKKIFSRTSSTHSSFSLNKTQNCFDRNLSKSQLSYFSEKKNFLLKDRNRIKQNSSSLFFTELYQHFLKTNANFDVKELLTRDFSLSKQLFFKAHKLLNFFFFKSGLEKLDCSSSLDKKRENFDTNFLQPSSRNSKFTKEHFFIFKELFYLYAYHLFSEFYITDSNAKLFSPTIDSFKVLRNRDLKSFRFAVLSQNKQQAILENSKAFTTASFFNIYAKKSFLLQSNSNSTIKANSLKKGLLKATLSQSFSLNQTNPIISRMFSKNLGFAWLYLNLLLTFNHINIDAGAASWKIQRVLLINSCYMSRQLPFLKSSLLYLFESYPQNMYFKKVLKTKSWALVKLQLLQPGNKFWRKPFLNFWTYFFVNSNLLALLFWETDFHLQNIRPIMAAWSRWFLNSGTWLSFSSIKLSGKDLYQTFLSLDLSSKDKVKQKVVSEFLTGQVFYHSLLQDFKNIVKNSGSLTQSNLILKLTPLLYIYSYIFFKEWDFNTVRMLDREIFNCLWKWACRRHNNKSKKCIRSKYFYRLTPNRWVFGCSKETLEFKKKYSASSEDKLNFLYLPLLSQVLFHLHLTKGLSKKFE